MQRSENENSTRRTGTKYEDAAAAYLEGKNYRILQRNFRCRTGEVDLIARDGAFLVFVEVKTRTGIEKGFPAEAVNAEKRRRLRSAAQAYQMNVGWSGPVRFDIIEISAAGLRHMKNAF